MEVAGGVASVLTLAELSYKVARRARLLHVRLRDAPANFDLLRKRISTLSIILDAVKELSDRELTAKGLDGALFETADTLLGLQHEIDHLLPSDTDQRKRTRLRWALFSASKVEKAQQLILETLHLFSVLIEVHAWKDQRVLHSILETCAEAKHTCSKESIAGPFESVAIASRKRGVISTSSWQIPSLLWFTGLSGSHVSWGDEKRTTHTVFIRLMMKKGRSKQAQAFVVDITWQWNLIRWGLSFSSLGRGLTVVNVVPPTALIIEACRAGDIPTIKNEFAKQRASIYDITPDNETLMSLAIDSGNAEVVQFLLDNGYKADWTFGQNQTQAFPTFLLSPLQWALYNSHIDIVRLLLTFGADGTYISAIGWTPLHYLLHGGRNQQDSWTPLSVLTALSSCENLLDVESKCPKGWSPLQLAATWYSGDAVAQLIRLGASMDEFGTYPWEHPDNPMWFAIEQGNMSSFRELLAYYEPLNRRDGLGMMMVSYTARYGRDEMTEALLRGGADEIYPDYQDHDVGSSDGPDEFTDQEEDYDWEEGRLKPWTRETYSQYIELLVRLGRLVVQPADDGDSCECDIFWDAVEDMVDFD